MVFDRMNNNRTGDFRIIHIYKKKTIIIKLLSNFSRKNVLPEL